jgi:cytochrome c-type biogenesis protein CcmH/NrfG
VAHDPKSVRAWFALGEAREITGDAIGAAAAFARADALDPGNPHIQRRLAMAACRAGDPLGRRLVEQLLIANPRDTELEAYLGPGPPPAAPDAYQPRD